MEDTFSFKISKKDLNKALRVLSIGYKSHRKHANMYSIAFSVDTAGKISLAVPGGEFIIDAETSGKGCFVLNYRWLKQLVKDCKMKSLEFQVKSGFLQINRSISIKVKQSAGKINLPLSLPYSVGELARLDLTEIDEEALEFWGMKTQIEDAHEEIENAIDKVYCQLAKYMPPQLTSNAFKEKLRKVLKIQKS